MRPAAGSAQSLSIEQRCFTPPELLGQNLVLGNVYGASDVLLQRLVFDDRSTDAADVPNLTIRSHDALGGIKTRRFHQNSLDQLCHGHAILWVYTVQVFLNSRRLGG